MLARGDGDAGLPIGAPALALLTARTTSVVVRIRALVLTAPLAIAYDPARRPGGLCTVTLVTTLRP